MQKRKKLSFISVEFGKVTGKTSFDILSPVREGRGRKWGRGLRGEVELGVVCVTGETKSMFFWKDCQEGEGR